MKIATEQVEFGFNNGVSMGSSLQPTSANIFAAYLEYKIVP